MSALIEAVGLHKRFGKTHALAGIDLALPQGQITAILGPNGAGKTTFVRAVATFDPLTRRRAPLGPRSRCRRRTGRGAPTDRISWAIRSRRTDDDRSGRTWQWSPVSTVPSRSTARAVLPTPCSIATGTERSRRSSRPNVLGRGMRRRLDLGASLVGNQKSTSAAPRRADHGPRSPQSDRTVGFDPRTRCEWN